MSANMIGRIFNDRYKITDRIGLGGMAEVYRAQDMTFNRVVALKIMLPQYASNPQFAERFRQEAAAAANLQSPYIVNVYDWGREGEIYYIVMEYVRGSDLKAAIKERGPIKQKKLAEIGAQACLALSAAHRLDIIHRDIKPQNIMIQPDGNIKVMDFGIAHAKNSVLTQTSSVLGTAHYVSPEQAQGKPLSASSDIYSLGVVLYEAATGKVPFDGPDAVSVAMKQVNEKPVPPRQLNPEISPAFEAVILKALAKNPADRFLTAHDFRIALQEAASGSANIHGADTQLIPNAAGSGYYNPSNYYATDGATELMPSVGEAKASGSQAQKQAVRNYQMVDDEEPEKKSKLGLFLGLILAALALAGIAFAFFNMNNAPDLIEVPDVTSMPQENAESELRNAGFVVGTITIVKSSDIDEGKVVSQDPQGKTRAKKGSKVNLNVSGGEDQVAVPDLSNMTADDANRALQQAGLTPQAGNGDYSDTVDVNRVIKQTPEAGSRVTKGSTVTYTISLGKESLSVPNVKGMTKADAESTLKAAGFQVKYAPEEHSNAAAGVVIAYNPTGQSSKGSAVTLTVSSGPEKKTNTSDESASGPQSGPGSSSNQKPESKPDSSTTKKNS